MLMRASLTCAIVALSQFSSASTTQAAEAFLCDKDRVVYVESSQLEDLKKTDACIASYFGIKLKGPAAGQPTTKDGTQLDLKTLTETGSADRFVPGQYDLRRVAALGSPSRQKTAPMAAPDTDYRNVKVLNASAGDGWFRHAR
jgi:hypothetical protein